MYIFVYQLKGEEVKKILLFFVAASCQLYSFMPNTGWIGSKDPKKHRSNYPLISGDNFRAMADHIYDETTLDSFRPEDVKPGDIVFLNTSLIFYFGPFMHPKIPSPYILISHNSDIPVPDYHIDMLEDPKLIAWFSPNIMIPHHPKLHVIPLGVNNAYFNKSNYLTSAFEIHTFERPLKAYLNFQIDTNPFLRGYVWNRFCNNSFYIVAKNRSYPEYLADMKQCAFVVSPAGFGIDCYRHWEALFVGCIPIMKHSTIDKVFDDLPVILVHDWSIVDEDLIISEYQKLLKKEFNYKKLLAGYWFDQIRAIQRAFRESLNV
jgi:hypothetical protein